MKKAGKIIGIVLGCLVCLVALVLLGARLFFRLPVGDYYAASEKTFIIPGLSDGFVAQGLEYDDANGIFLVDGYQKDKSASPIYFVKNNAKKPEKKINMLLTDGSAYTGHAGGIAASGDYVYVADGGKHRLLVYDYKELQAAQDNDSVKAIGYFMTEVSENDYVGPAFVTISGDRMIVGEFYRDVDYPTPDSHKFTTKAGDFEQALAVEYCLDAAAEFGISAEPVKVYTLPDQAQGMCINDGNLYVSTSWGTSKSHVLAYSEGKVQEQGTVNLLGRELPLYSLDSASLFFDGKMAPMSEEIVILDGKMYTMCESASNKYIFGKFTSAKWCYATDLKEFMK